MNPHIIRRHFPQASASLLAANALDYGKADQTIRPELLRENKEEDDFHKLRPKPQHPLRDEPLAAPEAQGGDSKRYHVSIVRVSKRLLDEDNLCGKYVCDFLRYCGAIPSDAPDKTEIRNTQRKAAKGESEHTEITITYP